MDLAGAADLRVAASHQEIEIPEMAAEVVQHDLHEVACACGRVHRAAAPAGAGAPGTVTYGYSLQAWCVYLMAAHAIPVHRCAELVEALTGARPSPGFVHGLLSRAAAAVRHANQLIRALIILARVVCADETPIRGGPGPKPDLNVYDQAWLPLLTVTHRYRRTRCLWLEQFQIADYVRASMRPSGLIAEYRSAVFGAASAPFLRGAAEIG